jgi:hypothetical protein
VTEQQGSVLLGAGVVYLCDQFHAGTPFSNKTLALSADGNTAVIGGNANNGCLGAAWIFTRTGAAWHQQGDKLQVTINSASAAAVHEGYAVGLSADGNTVVVGGLGYDVSARVAVL